MPFPIHHAFMIQKFVHSMQLMHQLKVMRVVQPEQQEQAVPNMKDLIESAKKKKKIGGPPTGEYVNCDFILGSAA